MPVVKADEGIVVYVSMVDPIIVIAFARALSALCGHDLRSYSNTKL